jgi:putative endonuclease
MAEHNETGSKGEEIARDYLLSKSYKILHANWKYYHKEIDIIAEHKDKLVICEVKSRPARNFTDPSELLSISKMKNLVDAAEAYIFKNDIQKEVRFDLIVVLFGEKIGIKHIEEAFFPGVNW